MDRAMFGGMMEADLTSKYFIQKILFQFLTNFSPLWIADAKTETETFACGERGMYMRAIEVDKSIAAKFNPDFRHTKWNISHKGLLNPDDPTYNNIAKGYLNFFKLFLYFRNLTLLK